MKKMKENRRLHTFLSRARLLSLTTFGRGESDPLVADFAALAFAREILTRGSDQ